MTAIVLHALSFLAALAAWSAPPQAAGMLDGPAIERGRYVFHAGACDSCHTDHPRDGPFLAGGRTLTTHLGTFGIPNITPDPETGIGRWTAEDFRRAMVEGVAPDGSHYYPVFPYPWYTGLSEEDISDLWAYLRTVEPVRRASPAHDLPFPLDQRPLIWFWKLFNFTEGRRVSDPAMPDAWNRGSYLVNHLGHCGACHTPKDSFFNFQDWHFLAGAGLVPGPYAAPNITPHTPTGIGGWSAADIVRVMRRAIRPDGTPVRGSMADYVISGSSWLSEADLESIAAYVADLDPIEGRVPPEEAGRDRRLDQARPNAQGDSVDEPGTGSVGSVLLMLSSGGRDRAK